ncbi:DUF2628 domain-containing protein [Desulfovibrio litoralis]|uniref:DUF2628 domain-containing protein n=1 Tax=Desulfovibrio litoralis DSM 11393 TaxID=1121455 RepID=A0A1M7TF63_9BACT|nr:DUF2628 domain-containing protein [Desulfovibrio litoralis]SHN69337.1 Protein of unknown function [Desulfovibrio litoralis DSM 11393]
MQNPTEQSQEPSTQQYTQASQTDQDPNGEFPPHIANLDVSLRLKNAFMLIEKYKMHSPSGIMMSPQDKNNAPPASDNRKMVSWLTFFFTPFYYIFTGMWRKGLVILAGTVLFMFALEMIFLTLFNREIPDPFYSPFTITNAVIWAKTAFYDRYRQVVKKEVFWW